MSGKNSKTVGAAVAAAPAPVANQTAATAGEAGLPIVTPPAEQPAGEQPAEEQAEAPAEARAFELVRFTAAIESLGTDDFEAALEAMHSEAHVRGLLTTEVEEEQEDEDEDEADEHADTRELLARFNLKRAWQDAEGRVHFDEKAARKAAGGDADSLTVIEA